jgi:tryptophanyl-tRNA synthetase
MNVLSGIQPTGRFHWGNYFGAIRQYIALQDHPQRRQAFYFIADLHALTTIRGEPETLRRNVRDAALDLLALGLDPAKATLFRQSDVPEVTELTWVLMTITQMHLLEKCHAYKDKREKGLPADAGLFTYPVLMAADILAYDSDLVPVGVDQVQHVEVTRDIAQRFNVMYGETLRLPQAHVVEAAAKVPGTDGEKMSKSYGNTIEIFEDPKKLRKKINGIKTDSKTVEEPKDPETDSVFTLYKLFATSEQQEELAARYRAGGMGYGEAKALLYEAAMNHFAEARERRARLADDPDTLEDILRAGASRARSKAREVVERVRAAVGLTPEMRS